VNITLCDREALLLAAGLAAVNAYDERAPVIRTDCLRMARKLGIEPEFAAAVAAAWMHHCGVKPLPREGITDGLASRF
jgi:hypothetical protein